MAAAAANGSSDGPDAVSRPLLVVIEDADAEIGAPGGAAGAAAGWASWGGEARRLLHLSVPLSAASVLSYLNRTITLAQVGALGSLQQSALALASTVYNITGLSLVMGVASGAETFLGQASGMGQHAVLGVVLQRSVLLSWAAAAAPLAAWLAAAPRLVAALGQQAELSALAGAYVRRISPALPLGGLNMALTLYLAMQGVVRPLTLIAAVMAALTPAANHLLIHTAGLGLAGAAASTVALHAAQSGLLVGLAAWHTRGCPAGAKPWTGFSWEAFQQVPAYLAVALPATGMMVVDWWAYEVLTLVAGMLPDAGTAVAACGVLFGVNVLCFLCVDGIGYAVKIRVAHLLGAGSASGARRSLICGAALGAGCGAALAAALLAGRGRWVAALFSGDPLVVATVVACVPWLAACVALGSFSTVVAGALRGCGQQYTGFVVNASAFWLFGLPVAAAASLWRGLGVPGLWMGMAAGTCAQLAGLAGVVWFQDWEGQVARSRLLVRSQSSRRAAAPPPLGDLGALEGGGGGGGGGVGPPLLAPLLAPGPPRKAVA